MKPLQSKKPDGFNDFDSIYWKNIMEEADKFASLPSESQESILAEREHTAKARRVFHMQRIQDETEGLIRSVTG